MRRCDSTTVICGAFFCVLAACCGCDSLSRPASTVLLDGQTMGTTFVVKVGQPIESSKQETLREMINQELEALIAGMSTYVGDSQISRFNQAGANEPLTIDHRFTETLDLAQSVHEQSGGAFDPTVGPLVKLWNFGPGRESKFVPPSDEQIQQAMARIGFDQLDWETSRGRLMKSQADIELDLSAIAKGYAVDCVAKLLEAADIQNYMVEIGGEVRVGGRKSNGDAWRIGIEKPIPNRVQTQTILEITDLGMATSGDYRNFYEHEGRRFSHTIDPATGRPVEHQLAACTVVGKSCALADAWATALMVLGPEKGYNVAVEHDIAAMLLIHNGKQIDIKKTPLFEELTAGDK